MHIVRAMGIVTAHVPAGDGVASAGPCAAVAWASSWPWAPWWAFGELACATRP
ncbi:MAG: hypothetical protein R2749_02500 [Acidimicrobiales bacterium]